MFFNGRSASSEVCGLLGGLGAQAKSGVQVVHGGGGGGLVAKLCQTLVIPWTVACQAPLSMGFSRQAYWSGLPFLSPGDLLNPGIKPGPPALQADSLPTEPPGKQVVHNVMQIGIMSISSLL